MPRERTTASTVRPAPATNLKPRQQAALDAITAAGYDGLHTDELGAHVHAWQGSTRRMRRANGADRS